MRKTTGGATTRYLWDEDDLVMELDGAGNPVREYAYYPGIDQPHAMRRVSDGAVFRYTQEQPGHVSGLVGAGNVVANAYTYTPWGESLSTQEQVPQPLRYAAREYDAETGLYFVRARYYDPEQGRFISQDPIGLTGGINPYAYASSDPANMVDPTGLCPWCLDRIIATGQPCSRGKVPTENGGCREAHSPGGGAWWKWNGRFGNRRWRARGGCTAKPGRTEAAPLCKQQLHPWPSSRQIQRMARQRRDKSVQRVSE